ncbi:MAG: molybdopterin molybdotransferase MoeA [Desulfobulbaceae bacterium]|nr:molybdopterin molybdotransferase MoeA [Desulfobulbaceae bacterium]
MVSFEEAMKIVLSDVRQTGTERVALNDSLNRILAEDVFSDIDMPPFDKAAVDGYACRREDLLEELEVIELVAAGDVPSKKVESGKCTKIMTGAMLPEGADVILMVEHTEELPNKKIRFIEEKTSNNIAYKAEDVKTGDLIWKKGMLIRPQHIATFAAVGCAMPLVYKKPKVAIMSTGDELVEPNIKPGQGKIRNSNAYQLIAQVEAANCIPNYMGIVPDNEEDTDRYISKALAENDMVVLTGGVSMGDFDFVPKIMLKNNVKILFQKVAIKPGRPTVFGKTDKSYIFGLPGNPVSSFINFEVFAKPLLYKMMGHDYSAAAMKLPLGFDFHRKTSDRLEFIPIVVDKNGSIMPVEYHGSAHIHAICLAGGIMTIPKDVSEIKKGEFVDVRPF